MYGIVVHYRIDLRFECLIGLQGHRAISTICALGLGNAWVDGPSKFGAWGWFSTKFGCSGVIFKFQGRKWGETWVPLLFFSRLPMKADKTTLKFLESEDGATVRQALISADRSCKANLFLGRCPRNLLPSCRSRCLCCR